jgi:hypothetical protein
VTILSVAPPAAKIPLPFARGVQQAMDRLLDDCTADAACKAAFPDFRGEFAGVLQQLEKGPVEVNAPNVFTGERQKVKLSLAAFVEQIRLMLYVPNAMSALPLLIHLAAQNDFSAFVSTGFQIAYQIYGQLAQGMQLSVLCGEDIPFISEAEIKQESAGSFYGDRRVRQLMQACQEWPQAKVARTFIEPIKGSAPVLIIAGEIDPVTPPYIAQSAARDLSHSRLLLVHNGTHTSYPCTENLAAEFIDRGSAESLDVSCLDQIKRPPFNLPRAP